MEKRLCLVVVVAAVWLHCSAQFSDKCSPADPVCALIPKEREYYCTISASEFLEQVYQNCRAEFNPRPQTSSCVVYTGMAVYVQCMEDNMTLYAHTDDQVRSLGAGDWMSPYVGREHEGLYECRFQNGTVYGYRNLSVKVEPTIGVGPNNGNPCNNYYCSTAFNGDSCCRRGGTSWNPRLQGANFSFSVYGEEPLSVTVETIWNESNHYPVDLGITLFNSSTTTKVMTFNTWPHAVDQQKVPEPIILVNASNSHGYSTTCFTWGFLETNSPIFANSSLPKNLTIEEGGRATFACHIGTTFELFTNVEIQYTSPSGQSPQMECGLHDCRCKEEKDCPISVQVKPSSLGALRVFYYEIEVSSVSLNHSGASVSCALWYDHNIQWKQKATLTVSQKRLLDEPSSLSDENVIAVVSPIVSVVVVAMVISVCSVLLVRWRKGRSAANLPREHDRVPLKDATESVTATPVDSVDVAVGFARAYSHVPPLPSIEVTGSCPPTRLSFWGKAYYSTDDTQSMDSGVIPFGSQSSSLEDVKSVSPPFRSTSHQLQVHSNGRVAVNMSMDGGRSRSLSDLRMNFQNRLLRRTRVYVSYTDRKIDWVVEHLKPLIERFGNTTVTVHDADMVAGHPVSEERLRLILEADKVIVVCSPDYSSSEWCKYELYQAIAKQPSLTDGKLIPVLCDGCCAAPDVIRGVVFIRDTDELFVRKLRAALFRTHHPSH